MIIAGFAGIGKTVFARKTDKRIIDLESSAYKWLLLDSDCKCSTESQKGLSTRTLNPEWPGNYIDDIEKYNLFDDVDYILVAPTEDIMYYLELRNFYIVIPSLDSKQEMLQRYRDRGNSKEFVNKMDLKYEKITDYLMTQCARKFVLQPGQYLSDITSMLDANLPQYFDNDLCAVCGRDLDLGYQVPAFDWYESPIDGFDHADDIKFCPFCGTEKKL